PWAHAGCAGAARARRGDRRHGEPGYLRGTRRARARAHDRAPVRGGATTLTPRRPSSSVAACPLRSRLIGKPPDSGSGHWRFESSLLSSLRSHRLAARTPASHVGNGGSIPPGTTPSNTPRRGHTTRRDSDRQPRRHVHRKLDTVVP